MFKKSVNEFEKQARKEGLWTQSLEIGLNNVIQSTLSLEIKFNHIYHMWTNLIRLYQTNFGEMFEILIHLLYVKLAIESYLLYGPLPNFLIFIIRMNFPMNRFTTNFIDFLDDLIEKTGLLSFEGVHTKHRGQEVIKNQSEDKIIQSLESSFKNFSITNDKLLIDKPYVLINFQWP